MCGVRRTSRPDRATGHILQNGWQNWLFCSDGMCGILWFVPTSAGLTCQTSFQYSGYSRKKKKKRSFGSTTLEFWKMSFSIRGLLCDAFRAIPKWLLLLPQWPKEWLSCPYWFCWALHLPLEQMRPVPVLKRMEFAEKRWLFFFFFFFMVLAPSGITFCKEHTGIRPQSTGSWDLAWMSWTRIKK